MKIGLKQEYAWLDWQEACVLTPLEVIFCHYIFLLFSQDFVEAIETERFLTASWLLSDNDNNNKKSRAKFKRYYLLFRDQMEKYARRCNVILGTRPSYVNCGNQCNCNGTHAWPKQRCNHRWSIIYDSFHFFFWFR